MLIPPVTVNAQNVADPGPRPGLAGSDRTDAAGSTEPSGRAVARPPPSRRKLAARTKLSQGGSHVPQGAVTAGFAQKISLESAWQAFRAGGRGATRAGPLLGPSH